MKPMNQIADCFCFEMGGASFTIMEELKMYIKIPREMEDSNTIFVIVGRQLTADSQVSLVNDCCSML
jgi:hypothetical protein